jgi:cytochrome c oxidase subunit 1
MLDAAPDHRYELPGPSAWPLILAFAVGVTFIVVIFTPWGISIGAVLCLLALIGWFWASNRPKKNLLGLTDHESHEEEL